MGGAPEEGDPSSMARARRPRFFSSSKQTFVAIRHNQVLTEDRRSNWSRSRGLQVSLARTARPATAAIGPLASATRGHRCQRRRLSRAWRPERRAERGVRTRTRFANAPPPRHRSGGGGKPALAGMPENVENRENGETKKPGQKWAPAIVYVWQSPPPLRAPRAGPPRRRGDAGATATPWPSLSKRQFQHAASLERRAGGERCHSSRVI